ncbi:putative CmcJ-like methyltransferase [Tothia fuscella]|uniref:CmcJ-like methyltransferase n=1 Tax=Tothia fuscella TaxID=1048955 RepID=A0A9P4TW98_9PEZI|nr:putative CmcJ-like methyltransferase [Tothia fuscella]
MQPEATHNDVVTELVFLKRDEKHKTEKPYKLQYDPGKEISRWNCKNEATSDIRVHDIRGHEKDFTLEKQGFAVLKLNTKLAPEDFDDDMKVKKVYYQGLCCLLKDTLGARRVEILEHGIRKRHPEFPISTGDEYEFLQPTSVVHIDFTLDAALDSSKYALKVNNEGYKRIQCVNVWKPLHGPVSDWPLALCDAQTVDMDRDCVATDVVTRTGFTENYQISPHEEHMWYYLSGQLADEVVVFRQTDTDKTYQTGVPHAGFKNTIAISSERCRESVEARALIYY